MNLNPNQISVRDDRSRLDVRRFRAFGAITCPRIRQDVPAERRSVANVNARHSISISSEATEDASKLQPIPITFIHMPATRTTSTGVLRINQFKVDALSGGFVGNKELSHCIRPTMDGRSELLSFFQTGFTDISQIFHNDTTRPNRFRPSYESFGSNMQEMFGYGSFVVPQSLKKSARGTSANRLHLGFGSADGSTSGVKLPALESKGFAVGRIGCCKKSFDAAVNSDQTTFNFWFVDIEFVG